MIAEVVPVKRGALKLPFFDYSIPEELQKKISVGQLVTIPLRGKPDFGVVISIREGSSEFELKKVSSPISATPFFSAKQIEFYREIAELYHSSLGSILKSALPPLKKRKLSKAEDLKNFKMHDGKNRKPLIFVYDTKQTRHKYFNSFFAESGQSLIILPEISDAEELYLALSESERSQSALFTSKTSDKDHYDLWFKVRNGDVKIVIGTRNALLLQFLDLRNVIIDNNFHFGHKSWDSAPRFCSKDLALLALKHLGAKIVLATHTLSVEDRFFLKNNIYEGTDAEHPASHPIEIANISAEKRAGELSPFGIAASDAISNTAGDVFIFCNRKGTSAYAACRDCGKPVICSNCRRNLTYHEKERKFICHICKNTEQLKERCGSCGGTNLLFLGLGTDGLEKELKKIFPEEKRRIIRIDKEADLAVSRTKDEAIIMIGTQFAWPQVEWERLGAMIFFDPDTSLFSPEYLSSEELFQLIKDACFRLPEDAKLILQTRNPEHTVFRGLSDPDNFYAEQLAERKLFGYPPYKYLLKLFYPAPSPTTGKQAAAAFYRSLEQLTKKAPDIKITGPFELFPAFSKGMYWQAIIVKIGFENYKKRIKEIMSVTPEGWKSDPGPIHLLQH